MNTNTTVYAEVCKRAKELAGQRKGQALYNTLYKIRREWALEITGSSLDPFYRDDIVPDFKGWLRTKEAKEAEENQK